MPKRITNEEFLIKVKNEVGDEYTALDEYINTKTQIRFRHNSETCNNSISLITPNHFFNGRRCKVCASINFKTKVAPKKTQEKFESEVYDLVKDKYTVVERYVDTHTKIKMRHNSEVCSNYEYKVAPTEFLKGNRCPKCKGIKHSITSSKGIDKFREEIEALDDGYKVIGEAYINNKQSIELLCPNGHRCFISYVNFKAGHRCKICASKRRISLEEQELHNFIKEALPSDLEITFNNDEIISPYELDVYIPSKNLAIEFNGLYYHSSRFKHYSYHLNKTKLCNKKGVRLIHIYDDEWKYKNSILKAELLRAFKVDFKGTLSLPIRDEITEKVKRIDTKTKNDFLKGNCLLGIDKNAVIRLGLYHNDILLAVMTFIKPTEHDSLNADYILSRFSLNIKYNIDKESAYEKLFSYFKKKYKWNKIGLYLDRRLFDEEFYLNNKWQLEDTKPPSFYYISGNYRVKPSPNALKDPKKKKKLKIYDCGSFILSYTKNS